VSGQLDNEKWHGVYSCNITEVIKPTTWGKQDIEKKTELVKFLIEMEDTWEIRTYIREYN
jgi:hypothetical protein